MSGAYIYLDSACCTADTAEDAIRDVIGDAPLTVSAHAEGTIATADGPWRLYLEATPVTISDPPTSADSTQAPAPGTIELDPVTFQLAGQQPLTVNYLDKQLQLTPVAGESNRINGLDVHLEQQAQLKHPADSLMWETSADVESNFGSDVQVISNSMDDAPIFDDFFFMSMSFIGALMLVGAVALLVKVRGLAWFAFALVGLIVCSLAMPLVHYGSVYAQPIGNYPSIAPYEPQLQQLQKQLKGERSDVFSVDALPNVFVTDNAHAIRGFYTDKMREDAQKLLDQGKAVEVSGRTVEVTDLDLQMKDRHESPNASFEPVIIPTALASKYGKLTYNYTYFVTSGRTNLISEELQSDGPSAKFPLLEVYTND